MATIIVHGTMAIMAASQTSWWWNSWMGDGFLKALSDGMARGSGSHDVWHINGQHVSTLSALTKQKWSLWSGRSRHISQHQGHFIWSGADTGIGRDVGATDLVKYLNLIASLTNEPIRVIAHSHGCNVVKNASSHRNLASNVFIEKAVFLACPHFFSQSANGDEFTYQLAPERFGKILNIYSPNDVVQVGLADAITGGGGGRVVDHLPHKSARIDQDPSARSCYEDREIETDASGIQSHSVLHGSVIGGFSGLWLNSNSSFNQMLNQLNAQVPIITAEDDGA